MRNRPDNWSTKRLTKTTWTGLYLCVTCYEIIPNTQYAFHRKHGECESPARPPAVKCKRKSNCNTCHRTFCNEKVNDFHEPCHATNNNTAEGLKKCRQKPKVESSAMAAAIRRLTEQISSEAAGKIATYRAILRKPNTDGTYNVNGKIMLMLDIEQQI